MYALTSRQERAAASARAISDSEAETLKEELSNILGECRILLPAIQALFGFQTIAVFNERFEQLRGLSLVARPPAVAGHGGGGDRAGHGAGRHAPHRRTGQGVAPPDRPLIALHLRRADPHHYRRRLGGAALLPPPTLAAPLLLNET